MIKFEVWTEGYAATGQSSSAIFHGEIMAETFNEACIKILGDSLDKDPEQPDGYRHDSGGNMSVWGCRCCDNKNDARKSFG